MDLRRRSGGSFVLRASHLDDLVGLGSITAPAARFLDATVRSGLNVLASGGHRGRQDHAAGPPHSGPYPGSWGDLRGGVRARQRSAPMPNSRPGSGGRSTQTDPYAPRR